MPKLRIKTETSTRAGVVEALASDRWGLLRDGADHALLVPYKPAERRKILREVERIKSAAREAALMPERRRRLAEWPPEMWPGHDLEPAMTPKQRRLLREVERRNMAAAPCTGEISKVQNIERRNA